MFSMLIQGDCSEEMMTVYIENQLKNLSVGMKSRHLISNETLDGSLSQLQTVVKSIRRLLTAPFKTMYFQNFCKNYCCKIVEATIMKNISNDSKLI